jgi:nucleoside-diphosphate-sugar epimerase
VSRAVVDVGEPDDVERAVTAHDVVVYCAVVREHRRLAFRVNAQGTYNAIRAAVLAGHDRFVNTGPVRSVVGGFDGGYQLAAGGASELSGKSPPWSGTGLYQVGHCLSLLLCSCWRAHVLTLRVVLKLGR